MNNGIQKKVDDAKYLWNNGRKESGFLLVLIAFASIAQKIYPNIKKDRERFEKLYRDKNKGNIGVEFRGKLVSIETVFYKWMRCELVHEGSLPNDIEIMEEQKPNSMSIRAGGKPEYILKIGEGWFYHLCRIIENMIMPE